MRETKIINIAQTHIQDIQVTHPSWFAFQDIPPVEVGDPIAFVTNGYEAASGIVMKIIKPGELYEDPTFRNWYQVIFR